MTLSQAHRKEISPARAALVALVTLLATGALAFSSNASNVQPSIRAESEGARELLKVQIGKLPLGVIKSADIASPSPADVSAGVSDLGDNWLWIEATATDRSDAVASAFQASFLGGAFADAAQAADIRGINGMTVRVRDVSGVLLEENAWFIPPSSAAPLPAIASDREIAKAAIAERFRVGAKRIGASLKTVSYTYLPRLVPDATIKVENPNWFVANARVLLSAIIGSDEGYDGRIIRVVDMNDKPVCVSAYNFRTRSGETWIDSEYETIYRPTVGLAREMP